MHVFKLLSMCSLDDPCIPFSFQTFVSLCTGDREVFRVLLRLAAPATLPRGKASTKMNE